MSYATEYGSKNKNKMCQDFLLGQYQSCLSRLTESTASKFSLAKFEDDVDIVVYKLLHGNTLNRVSVQPGEISEIKEFEKLLTTAKSFPSGRQAVFIELTTLYNLLFCKLATYNQVNDISNTLDKVNLLTHETLQRVLCLITKTSQVYPLTETTCPQKILKLLSDCLEKQQLLQIYGVLKPFVLVACVWCFIAIIVNKFNLARQCLETLLELSLDSEKIPAPGDHGLLMLFPVSVLKENPYCDDGCMPLAQIVQFLSGIVYFKLEDRENCDRHLSNVTISDWQPYSALMKALVSYNAERYNDVLSICQQILYIDKPQILNTVKAYLLNLLGSSHSKKGNIHLAIESYREALNEDFSFLPSLYNISLQYQKLGLDDAELESLNFLFMTLEDSEENSKFEYDNSLNISSFIDRPVISLSQALYKLANRCLQLKRYEAASGRYLDLIAIITDSNFIGSQKTAATNNLFLKENSILIPDSVSIYIEACSGLTKSCQYEQCLLLCDAALKSYSSDATDTSESDIQSLLSEEQDEFEDLFDDEDSIPRKRQRSLSISLSRDKKWIDVQNEVILMIYRAEALIKMNNLDDATDGLHRVIETLQEFPTTEVEWMRDTLTGEGQTLEPQVKRRRISLTGKHVSDEENISCQKPYVLKKWESLMTETCSKLSRVLLSQKKYQDAIHFTRLALQLEKDSSISWYTYVEILENMKRDRDGYKSWLKHRGVGSYADSFHLANELKIRQVQERSIENSSTSEMELHSEKKYLQMDIKALQYMMKYR